MSDEVKHAVEAGLPVVALESTIISHGMKYPENYQTALDVEAVVRAGGAVPATIAVIKGVLRVGLSPDQIEHIAKRGTNVRKCSQRELPFVIATEQDGSLTVAATMFAAHMAGIHVFVTGGIGGVHRGYESTLDMSNDLHALATIPVAVVCAGAKSILDIPRTLEALETLGVPVTNIGSDNFPAFYSPDSGVPAPLSVSDPFVIGDMLRVSHRLGLRCGHLVTVPVPAHLAADCEKMESATQQALAEMRSAGITGATTTPFLLKRIAEITHGESLRANIALILNNANVGAAIATRYASIGVVCPDTE